MRYYHQVEEKFLNQSLILRKTIALCAYGIVKHDKVELFKGQKIVDWL